MIKRLIPAASGFVVVLVVILGGAWLWQGGLGPGEQAAAPSGMPASTAPAAAPVQADATTLAMGKKLYGDYCASCHGMNLEGQPNWKKPTASGVLPAPPHDATGHTWHHADALIFDYTKRGGKAVVGGDFKSGMPGFGGLMSDDQIWAVIAYIKSRWPADIRARQAALNKPKN